MLYENHVFVSDDSSGEQLFQLWNRIISSLHYSFVFYQDLKRLNDDFSLYKTPFSNLVLTKYDYYR